MEGGGALQRLWCIQTAKEHLGAKAFEVVPQNLVAVTGNCKEALPARGWHWGGSSISVLPWKSPVRPGFGGTFPNPGGFPGSVWVDVSTHRDLLSLINRRVGGGEAMDNLPGAEGEWEGKKCCQPGHGHGSAEGKRKD